MSKTIPDWMAGELEVEFRAGVKVFRVPCTSRCGLPRCPSSADCRTHYVYQMRFYADGSSEWRRATSSGVTREEAIAEASRRALDGPAAYGERGHGAAFAYMRSVR